MALLNFQVGPTQAQQLQAKALEEQEAARARQAAGLKTALSPFGAETAGELGGLLTSGVGSLEQLGAGQLAELQARRSSLPAAPATPMDIAKLESEQAQGLQRRSAAALNQARINEIQNAVTGIANTPLTYEQQAEIDLGYPLPKNHIVGRNPFTGATEPMPAPNTPLYNEAQTILDANEQGAKLITKYLAALDSVGPTGTEFGGPDATKLFQRYEQVVNHYREMANLGVPSGIEFERIEQQLPNPTSLWNNIMGGIVGTASMGLGADWWKQGISGPAQNMLDDQNDFVRRNQRQYWYADSDYEVPPPSEQ